MSALKSIAETQNQPELDFGAPDVSHNDSVMRLASADDRGVPSPVAAMQADLETQWVKLSSPGRWPVGGMVLALLATGAIMWWAIIGGVLALMHG